METSVETIERTDWAALAEVVGKELAKTAAEHDAEGTFVATAFETLKRNRMFSMAVPAELGGGGASHSELCEAIRILAHGDPAAALSFSMHSHLVAAAVWRYRNGKPAEQLLRKIAEQELVLVSTGGTDWIDSSGVMRRVEGGYVVSARKPFGSGSPGADMLITSSRFEDKVLHFPVSFAAEGVKILDDWDTLGMRGTGSNTVVFEDVFVPDSAIALERPQGEWHAAWTVAAVVALPVFMSAYVGVAETAAELARDAIRNRRDEPQAPFMAGELENALATTRMAWRELMRIANEYEFSLGVESANAAFIAKTLCTNSAIDTVEKAMELTGGRGYFTNHPLQRLFRDIHAASFHPLPEKRQLLFTGRIALGLDPISGS